ncbi:uncharacterized protein J3D65DRAFT_351941 [Phyllosticta citribraziliensis]|uniref:Uncharacterized protein n=1 Tax=Phyllosticta citribraziliensis TaxID=989973 RepID=A0ABR1LVT2_9PEZI
METISVLAVTFDFSFDPRATALHSAPTALPLSLRERIRHSEATAARHWGLETTRGCTSETPLSILVVPESSQDGTFLPTGPHHEDAGSSQINDQPRVRGSCFLIGLASHSCTCFESSPLSNDALPSRLCLHNSRLFFSASSCNASWETSRVVVDWLVLCRALRTYDLPFEQTFSRFLLLTKSSPFNTSHTRRRPGFQVLRAHHAPEALRNGPPG